MKKMAKRFFSSVIVLAMLMALLPATVSQAAALVSRDFESEADLSGFPKGLWGSVAYEWDNTVSYNGQASMKAIQSGGGYGLMGVAASYEYGKTYRISARVKFDNPDNVTKKVNFEIFGDKASTTVNWSILGDTYLRARSPERTVSDGEWHLFTEEFVFTNVDGGATAKASATVGVEANIGTNDTLWIDDFSVVEVLSVDENKKGSFVAFKSFEGASLEVSSSYTITQDRTTAYEGEASARIELPNNSQCTAMDIGEYEFEIGQYYRVTAYVKSSFSAEKEAGFRFELRGTENSHANVLSGASKFNGGSENRPGFSLGFWTDDQYPDNGNVGLTRFSGTAIDERDTDWQRVEKIFTVKSTDANITKAKMKLSIYMDPVPEGSAINLDSIKLEKLGIDGSHAGMSGYGAAPTVSGVPTGAGIATGYKFVALAENDQHTPNMVWNMEQGKKYRATVKVYVPSSNKAAVDAFAETWKETYPAAAEPKITFGDASVDLVYDQWVTLSYDIDWTQPSGVLRRNIDGINVRNQSSPSGTNLRTVKETFYFGAFDVVEIKDEAETATVPTISMNVDDWIPVNAGRNHVPNFEGKADAIVVSNENGVLYQDVTLNDGQEYLAKAKFYVPSEKIKEDGTTEIRFFIIDGERMVPWNAEDPTRHDWTTDVSYAEKYVTKALTAADGDKWITVALPFTHAKPSYDTDDSYRLKAVVVNTTDGNGNYYISEVEFVEPSSADIENVEIQNNGTVTYDANDADYFLSYEYLDGVNALVSGTIFAGEFLPKFDLTDATEPIVKLTATNAYGVVEETVTGTKAVEETPDIGGDDDEGAVVVNSVEIIGANNADGTPAQDVEELGEGMYLRINYNNPTEADEQAWVMMAFYNADGLITANKHLITLAAEGNEGAVDIEYPEYPGIIDLVAGATQVKAFIWDVDSINPLCAGYVVD